MTELLAMTFTRALDPQAYFTNPRNWSSRANTMFRNSLLENLRDRSRAFGASQGGNVAITFALALVPVFGLAGAALDYSRGNSVKAAMQDALDATTLMLARNAGMMPTSEIPASAGRNFNAQLKRPEAENVVVSAAYDLQTSTVSASASATLPTAILGVIGVNQLTISVNSAAASTIDNSCILTLDHGQPTSHVSLALNGAPVLNLSGCTIRSNTSLDCSGHDGQTPAAIAAGMASGCSHPKSNAPVVPDIYAPLASNISAKCGALGLGATWAPGVPPLGAALITVSKGSYTEYHICGDLTVSGTGSLTGAAPGSDSVIIIENGSLNIDDKASINTIRTAIVLTGNNTQASSINFPNGTGKAATLSLSPPIDPANPWQGVSLYQDPALTNGVNDTWGSGTNFNADGVVYLPNANVVTDGNMSSSNSQCAKFVINSLRTNGSINLSFDQTISSCAAIGMKQWSGISVRLVK